ncbi:MAG TPA: hypothetical protein VEI02_05180 [Planctomycetota bacterium]|nr:hypothetical protein [Planctomycetota bacterium]
MSDAGLTPEQIEAVLESTEVRLYRPGDEVEILRVFHKVFPYARRSIEEWNWEFRDNPAGLHAFVAATPEGRILAQFAGLPRRVKAGAETRCFSEIVDSLVDPDFRQGLKKPGLFGRCVYAAVDHYGRPDRETVMYGLPNPQAFRIGARMFGYSFLHDVQAMALPVGEAPPPSASGRVERVREIPADVDALWEAAAKHLDVATVRDRVYLDWRYVRRPGAAYRLYSVRDDAGRLAAFFVLADRWIEGTLNKRVTVVADLMTDRINPAARLAPETAPKLAAEEGAEEVWCVVRPQSDEWRHLAEIGYRPTATPFKLVARTYDREVVPLERLRDGWYFTLGDFDVV